MADILQFPQRPALDDMAEIDIYTAVEVAIRDLREISAQLKAAARQQADDCREMLESVLRAADA